MAGTVLTFYLLSIAVWMLGAIGWGMNAVAVVSGFVHNAPVTTLFIGRVIGIFAFPIGALLGWF